MKNFDFVAIDFETANPSRKSACSMGLVFVNDGEIVDRKYFLIKPTPNYYDCYFTRIHNISEADTKDKPTFKELWPEIKPMLENSKYVVAHRTAVDVGVIRDILDDLELPYPDFFVVCTEILSKYALPDAKNYELKTVTEYLGIEFNNHHHSLYDAEASAKVLIEIAKRKKCYNLDKLLDMCGVQMGRIKPQTSYKSCIRRDSRTHIYNDRKVDIKAIREEANGVVQKETVLNGAKVVITGLFKNYDRIEMVTALTNLGAIVSASISSKTQFVIVGRDAGASKIQKIEELQNAGSDIKVISEQDIINMLEN